MSKQMRWFFKYKKWVPVRGLSSYKLLEYSFRNKKNKKSKFSFMDQMDFQKIKSKLENFCAYQERSQYEVEKKT